MKKFLDVAQLADWLGVPRSWIYERTRRNGSETIPHLKLGKYIRFDPNSEEFQSWLEAHRCGTVVGSPIQTKPQAIENKGSKTPLQRIYNKT